MNSITKRWVRGSLLVTILMCLVAEAVFLYYSITNYYDGARRAMTTRTSTIITQLNASAAQTGESQGVLLRRTRPSPGLRIPGGLHPLQVSAALAGGSLRGT